MSLRAFLTILSVNEPAGNLAKIIVIHTVKLVVHAWDHAEDNANQVVETCLECLFHPDFHDSKSTVQREMVRPYFSLNAPESQPMTDAIHA
jgi:Heterokaryon incompatibility protein Het-C